MKLGKIKTVIKQHKKVRKKYRNQRIKIKIFSMKTN